MSEAYFQESEESNSDSKEKDSKQNGSSKKTSSVKQSSEKTSQEDRFILTSQKSISKNSNQSTSSPEDSHAKMSRKREKEKEWLAKEVAYGKNTPALLGKYDPSTGSLKTFQASLLSDSMTSLQILPVSGMMRNGLIYSLPISEHHIEEKESLSSATKHQMIQKFRDKIHRIFLPTIVASDTWSNGLQSTQQKEGSRHSINLPQALLPTLVSGSYKQSATYFRGNKTFKGALLPTICSNESHGSGKKRFQGAKDSRYSKMSEKLRTCENDPIYLNPFFAEAVMGFPTGWTELNHSETQSFRNALNLLRDKSKKKRN